MSLTLYPHQVEGVRWLKAQFGGCILAFQMRCGKTSTILASLDTFLKPPVLVTCPKSAIGVWRREVAAWRPGYSFASPKEFRWPRTSEVVAINPERLGTMQGWPVPGTVFVADEATCYKHKASLRTIKAGLLREAIMRVGGKIILATGTPIERSPEDLLNLLKFIGAFEYTFKTMNYFHWCFNSTLDAWGNRSWGKPRPEAWKCIQKTVLYKRLVDVMPWLPKVTLEDLPVELETGRWSQLCDRFQRSIQSQGLTLEQAMTNLKTPEDKKLVFELRKALALAKTPLMLDYVERLEKAGEPTLVFSAHRAPIDTLAKRPGWGVLHGDISDKKREETVAAFQAGKLLGLGLTIQVGGMSLDLSRATRVLFVDPAWNPGPNMQAAARASGPKQKKPVLVQFMVADHAVDIDVYRLISAKMRVQEGALCPEKYLKDGYTAGFSITQRVKG